MNNTQYLTSKFYPHFCSETIYNNQDLPIRLVTNRELDIDLIIPNPLALSLRITPSSTEFQQNSQPITIFLHFSSNSTTFV